MTNNRQQPDLQSRNTTGDGLLGEGAEKYIRDSANIEDLPGDDDDLEIDDEDDDEDDDLEADYDDDDVETEEVSDGVTATEEEDEDYINKDEAKRDLREQGLRP